MCPGNHDIDHDVIRSNSLLQDAQDAILNKQTDVERENQLTRRLQEPEGRKLFYAPLQQFNDFASRYDCAFFPDAESFAWDRDLTLNDGSVLRIRGLNSTLFSGPSDVEGRLFLGSRAATLPRRDGVEYLTICHHPSSWLRDRKQTEDMLDDRARIQLFGHEHEQRVVEGVHWVKFFAGAVNPHRAEPRWQPGYNLLEISVEASSGSSGAPAQRKMKVLAHVREWQLHPGKFRAHVDRGGNATHQLYFELAPWSLPPMRPSETIPPIGASPAPDASKSDTQMANVPKMSPRELVYRFFRLSLSKKSEIIGRLRLLEEADRNLPDFERYRRALMRAKERGDLNKLEDLIIGAEKDNHG